MTGHQITSEKRTEFPAFQSMITPPRGDCSHRNSHSIFIEQEILRDQCAAFSSQLRQADFHLPGRIESL